MPCIDPNCVLVKLSPQMSLFGLKSSMKVNIHTIDACFAKS